MLAENAGRVVTREELQKRLWPQDTFLDFEDGLNTAVKKLRDALGDDAEQPHYIETVPRHGYRFLAEVTQIAPPARAVVIAAESPSSAKKPEEASAPIDRRRTRWTAWVIASRRRWRFWVAWASGFSTGDRHSLLVRAIPCSSPISRIGKVILDLMKRYGQRSRSALSSPAAPFLSGIRVGSILQLMGKPTAERVTPEVGREICQRENIRGMIAGSITRTGQEYALSAELIDPQTGATVRSYIERSSGEDHILDALDVIAADVRSDLGESLYQIHRADRPLPEVTTSSLTALKQYADGIALWHQGKFGDAVTLLRAAVQTDPDFAMAHAARGGAYFSYLANQPVEGKQDRKRLSRSPRAPPTASA